MRIIVHATFSLLIGAIYALFICAFTHYLNINMTASECAAWLALGCAASGFAARICDTIFDGKDVL